MPAGKSRFPASLASIIVAIAAHSSGATVNDQCETHRSSNLRGVIEYGNGAAGALHFLIVAECTSGTALASSGPSGGDRFELGAVAFQCSHRHGGLLRNLGDLTTAGTEEQEIQFLCIDGLYLYQVLGDGDQLLSLGS
jgi:hypothetical protein